MLALNVDFFVTLDPSVVSIPRDIDFANRVTLPILERTRTSELFTPMTVKRLPHLLIFRHAVS
jgi:hypothetical protein